MRKLRLFPTLFLLLIMACQKTDNVAIPASDSLYRRWHLVQSRKAQDTTWTYNMDSLSDMEFRLDGALVYRRNNIVISTPCCAGSRFERNETTVRFLDANGCPNALCASLSESNSSTITVLTNKIL